MFERYPNAREIYHQSVSLRGGGGFVWWSYATTDPLAVVVTHYERMLGRMAAMKDAPARSFDFEMPGAIMSIYAASDYLAFPNGGAAHGPRPDDQTVLLFATRPFSPA